MIFSTTSIEVADENVASPADSECELLPQSRVGVWERQVIPLDLVDGVPRHLVFKPIPPLETDEASE